MDIRHVPVCWSAKEEKPILKTEAQQAPPPVYDMMAELIFFMPDGLLVFMDEAVQLGAKPHYTQLRFPINAGDLAASNYIKSYDFCTPKSIEDAPLLPVDEFWSGYYRKITEYGAQLELQTPAMRLAVYNRRFAPYFLMNIYVRICKLTGCPFSRVYLTYFCDYQYSYGGDLYSAVYVTPDNHIVFSRVITPNRTAALFKEEFIREHPEYFFLIPTEDVLLYDPKNLGLTYGLPWLMHKQLCVS